MSCTKTIRSLNREGFLIRKLTRLHVAVMFAAVMLAGVVSARAQVVEFPLHADDLKPDERILTDVHGTAGGPQTGAKDLFVYRRVANNNWQVLKDGQNDNTKNSNYLIYGRPVYAMASGTVIGCWRNAPENTGPTRHPDYTNKKILLQGNHLWIQQTDGNIALYAHAQTGDIPASLCPNNAELLTGDRQSNAHWTQPEATVANGATVTAGQLLFHVGNSGNSGQPHLHVHIVNSSDTWQQMKFARGQTTPFTNNTASLYGPWTALKGKALPNSRILIWPPHSIRDWTYNGIDGPFYQPMFNHFVDSGVMADKVTCKNNGVSYDTTWVPAKGSWASHHSMTIMDYVMKSAMYMNQGYLQTSFNTCGSLMVAVWRKS